MKALITLLAAATVIQGVAAALANTSSTGAVAPATAKARLSPVTLAGCAAAPSGRLGCFAEYRKTSLGSRAPVAGALPPGLGPTDIASAYHLNRAATTTNTVAIVDAYDDPNAEADLTIYRRTYGVSACTTANGCFAKVNQRGDAARLPDPDEGWAEEISLDLDAVSAACPTCYIRLVEADDNSDDNLGAAEDTAVALRAAVVSNSYGSSEFAGLSAEAAHYKHPGTPIVASVGDDGFGPPGAFPAVLSSTIAVGGTTLTKAANTARGWTESAWSGSQSACSAYIRKPSWQQDKHCSMRTVADISAVADPATGLAGYDSYVPDDPAGAGWLVFGGTSVSSPLIAAMIARAGRTLNNASWIYTHTAALYDPTEGNTGYCGSDYLCTAEKGYDAPSGVGTPNGLGAL